MPAEPTAIMREGLLPGKFVGVRAMLRTGVGFDRLTGSDPTTPVSSSFRR